MDTGFFIKGLIFGVSIAAPVGPIGILCIRRSLTNGWTAGLLTGMGAATADAVYGSLAAFGLAGITSVLVGQSRWIGLLGGLFLCGLGFRIVRSRSDPAAAGPLPAGAAVGYLSALLLTLTNPMTILSFAAVFAGMGLGAGPAGPSAAVCLVAGVFCGSMAWWTVLSSATTRLNRRLTAGAMTWINRLSGGILIGFGLIAAVGRLSG